MAYIKIPEQSTAGLKHGSGWEFSLQPLRASSYIQEQFPQSRSSSKEFILASESTDRSLPSLRTRSENSRKLDKVIAWSQRFHGWQKGVLLSCMAAGSTLLLNTILFIVAYIHYDPLSGAGTLYHGNCDEVRYTSITLHLLINIVSTALLAASSYTMQCLSAPTRLDVDKAHKERRTLYIGVVSIKNMLRIGRMKALLWCFLGISTLPLHLLWNSVIISRIASNDYLVLVVEDKFLAGEAYLEPLSRNSYHVTGKDIESIRASYHAGNFTRYDAADCISTYGAPFVSKARNLLAITAPVNGSTRMSPAQAFVDLGFPAGNASDKSGLSQPLWNGSSLIAFEYHYGGGQSNLDWLCNGYSDFLQDYLHRYCDKDRALQYLKNEGSLFLRPDDRDFEDTSAYKIEYCLSEDKIQQRCTLQYVPAFLATVTVCNLIKFICMLITFRLLARDSEPILATVGDAIASFVDQPDEHSKDMCMLGISNQREVLSHWRTGNNVPLPYMPSKRRARLFSATGKGRTILTLATGLVYTIIGALLLLLTISVDRNRGLTLSQTLNAGLGAADKDHNWGYGWPFDIKWETNWLASQVFFANIWQVALAVVYFMLNSLLTAQAAALEWASHSQSYRPLRVTFPEGKQKSKWFLQLPFKAAVPLIITLTLIHWLISQAIFVLFVECYGVDGSRNAGQDLLSIGYSPVAILCVVCFSGALLLCVTIHGLRGLPSSIPLHGNMSIIISAACHPTSDASRGNEDIRGQISRGLLRWGAVDEDEERRTDMNMVGHCSLDAENVFEPVVGKTYL